MGHSEETPADRKTREKEAAKAMRDAEKADEATARLAQSSLLKLEPVHLELQAILAHSSFGQVSEIVREPIRQDFVAIVEYISACNDGGPLPFDQKTLAIHIARTRKDIVLCKNMLCSIARAAGR